MKVPISYDFLWVKWWVKIGRFENSVAISD